MTAYPPLGVMLLTYDRLDHAKRTVRAFLDNIRYSGDLLFHVADDGSPEGYREDLFAFAGSWANVKAMGLSNSERRGYGASYNLGTMALHERCGLVLPLEDDWVLDRELDLDPLARVLLSEELPRLGCIRLGYLGYMPGSPLWGGLLYRDEQAFLVLDPDSPSEYVFSGHPRLETVAWARRVGPWPEYLRAGEVELSVGSRRTAREGVAWPLDLIRPAGGLFVHIGDDHPVKDAPLAISEAVMA